MLSSAPLGLSPHGSSATPYHAWSATSRLRLLGLGCRYVTPLYPLGSAGLLHSPPNSGLFTHRARLHQPAERNLIYPPRSTSSLSVGLLPGLPSERENIPLVGKLEIWGDGVQSWLVGWLGSLTDYMAVVASERRTQRRREKVYQALLVYCLCMDTYNHCGARILLVLMVAS
jgi:hypothetical protein